jgi:hypothetical protein
MRIDRPISAIPSTLPSLAKLKRRPVHNSPLPYNANMWRSFFLVFLVALQVFSSLANPVSVTSSADAQHRTLHAGLPNHHHDDQIEHEHHSLHAPEVMLEICSTHCDTVTDFGTDHHHHPDANQSVALLSEHTGLSVTGLSVQNPIAMPEMSCAELRANLRPPRA